ncbi:thiamine phosphate synthase [Rhodopirellula halodulae]|uniref:thiamine phosphate synthase n=1 Tax=Rhodopirellula halodulae TaxID=2894198 RepID=UPI002106DC5E|nr:thiamine phosphate synthase [Rhodopirellula sp. JC740]
MTNDESRTVLRILDANFNRAGEGLRTLEESARFILDDPSLSDALKTHRHNLSEAMKRWDRLQLISARDTPGDVGTELQTASEQTRVNLHSVVSAAAVRTQQALRCLEEYGKTIDAAFASKIETLRYRCYATFQSLELRIANQRHRAVRIRASRLYALIDCEQSVERFESRIRELAGVGVDVLQLRDRSVDDRTLFERAEVGTKLSEELGLLWIINDRADIAMAVRADGVHVGQEELPVDAARQVIGPDRLIGLSTHDMEQVRGASQTTADYIGCGPTFPGRTKNFDHFPGCEFLSQVHQATRSGEINLPAFAIGGISTSNIRKVAATGIARVAVSGALASGEQLPDAASQMRAALEANPLTIDVGDKGVREL